MPDPPKRPKPKPFGLSFAIPSERPQPDSEPPSPVPYRDHTGALISENKALREESEAFRRRMGDLENRLERYQRILEEKRLRSISPHLDQLEPKRTVPQWAAGLVAVIAALGAAGAFKVLEAMTAKPTVAPSELQEKEKDSKARDTAVLDYLTGLDADTRRRNDITVAVLCALNGGPPARDVKCPDPVKACEPKALTDGKKIVPGQPICKSPKSWPARRQPPQPQPPKPTEDE